MPQKVCPADPQRELLQLARQQKSSVFGLFAVALAVAALYLLATGRLELTWEHVTTALPNRFPITVAVLLCVAVALPLITVVTCFLVSTLRLYPPAADDFLSRTGTGDPYYAGLRYRPPVVPPDRTADGDHTEPSEPHATAVAALPTTITEHIYVFFDSLFAHCKHYFHPSFVHHHRFCYGSTAASAPRSTEEQIHAVMASLHVHWTCHLSRFFADQEYATNEVAYLPVQDLLDSFRPRTFAMEIHTIATLLRASPAHADLLTAQELHVICEQSGLPLKAAKDWSVLRLVLQRFSWIPEAITTDIGEEHRIPRSCLVAAGPEGSDVLVPLSAPRLFAQLGLTPTRGAEPQQENPAPQASEDDTQEPQASEDDTQEPQAIQGEEQEAKAIENEVSVA